MASLVAGTVRAVTSTSQIISGAYELSRSLVDLLKPASSRLDPNEAHYIFCIQRQIDCLLGPLELCMSWCRYRHPIAQRTIHVVEETLRRVIDCLQKIEVVSGSKQSGIHASESFKRSYTPAQGLTSSAKGTSCTPTLQILRRCLDELDIAVAQLTLTLTSLQLWKQHVSSINQTNNDTGETSNDVNKCLYHEQHEETISISTLLKSSRRLWEMENKYGDVCLQPGRLLLRLCVAQESVCEGVKWVVILPRCFLRISKTTDDKTVIIFEKSEASYPPTRKSSFSPLESRHYHQTRNRTTAHLSLEATDCDYLLVDENGSVKKCSRHDEDEKKRKKRESTLTMFKTMSVSNESSTSRCQYNKSCKNSTWLTNCHCFDPGTCKQFPQCPERLRFPIKVAEFMQLCFGEAGPSDCLSSSEEHEKTSKTKNLEDSHLDEEHEKTTSKTKNFADSHLDKVHHSSNVENFTTEKNCCSTSPNENKLDSENKISLVSDISEEQSTQKKNNNFKRCPQKRAVMERKIQNSNGMSKQLDSIIDEAFITKPFLIWPLLLQKPDKEQTKSECNLIDLRSFMSLLKTDFSNDMITLNYICSILKTHFNSHNCKAFPVGPLFAFDFYDCCNHDQFMLNNRFLSVPHAIIFGQDKGLSPLEFLYTARLCSVPESVSKVEKIIGKETGSLDMQSIIDSNELSCYADKKLTTQKLWSKEYRPPSFGKKLIHSVFEPHPANVRMSDDLMQELLCNCFVENVTKR